MKNKITKFWRKIFPPNDWKVVWTSEANPLREYNELGQFIGGRFPFHTVEYSEFRQKLRVKGYGKYANTVPTKQEAYEVMARMERKILKID